MKVSGGLYKDRTLLIGNAPMLELTGRIGPLHTRAKLYAKLESNNPCGSVKCRIGNAMVKAALESGTLKPGGTVIEPTSGNTGIAIAFVARAYGLKCVLTMPESMSIERRKLLKAYGAEIVLTPASEAMGGAIAKARELCDTNGAVVLGQFENPANPAIHRVTTAVEILKSLDKVVPDAFVAGVGTGGTISGVGSVLKEHFEHVKVVAVEPVASAVISGQPKGKHRIQGIGAGFVPKNLDTALLDAIETVSDDDAIAMARGVASDLGLLVGISSGAALHGAVTYANKLLEGLPDTAQKHIVVILPDGGERYLSAGLYEE